MQTPHMNLKGGNVIMPKLKSYEKETSELSNLFMSVIIGIVITLISVILLGVYSF